MVKPPTLRQQVDTAWDSHNSAPTIESESRLYETLLKMANAEARRRFGGVNEDAAGVALVRLVEALKSNAYAKVEGAKFSTWAGTIVENAVTNELKAHIRRKKAERGLDLARHGKLIADPGLKVEQQERLHALEASKNLLPSRQRQVVEGMLAGKSGNELAVEMGVSKQAITKLWKKALRRVEDGR